MKNIKTKSYILGLFTLVTLGVTYAYTSVSNSLTYLRGAGDTGHIGYIITEMFGTDDKIDREYLDLPSGLVINDATVSVTGIVMLDNATGSTLTTKAPTINILTQVWNNLNTRISALAPTTRTITAGSGLVGGGDFTTNRVLGINTLDITSCNENHQKIIWDNSLNRFICDTLPSTSTTSSGIVQLVHSTGSVSINSAPTAGIIKTMRDSLLLMIDSKVTSSGAVNNYLSKFSGTGVITYSQIYDNGNNVGIGNESPSERLEVTGNLKLGGSIPTYRIKNIAEPVDNNDAANKIYVDSVVSAGTPSSGNTNYLENGSYYSEGGQPYFCRLNTLEGTTQRIISINQNKLCNTTSNLYCNAGNCNANSSILESIKETHQLVSANDHQTCSISDGQVYCWGYSGNGQKYLDMSMSSGNQSYQGHSCSVLGDGRVACWGSNTYGQLGVGNQSTYYEPVIVSGITNAVKVYTASAGYSTNYGRSCALLSDGTVRCWGNLPTDTIRTTPIAISGLSGVVDFSMSQENSGSNGHWCAVINTGAVRCGGTGNYGQLGNGASIDANWITGHVAVSDITNAVKVYTASSLYSTNYGRSCALLVDGTVKCWGYLSGEGATSYNTPQIISGLSGVLDFSLSHVNASTITGGHWCAVLNTGAVRCGGTGNYGQLGNGASSNVNWITGHVAVSGITNAVKVYTASSGHSTNYGRSCALLSDGTVRCWGYLPSDTIRISPVPISGLSGVVDFSMSQENSFIEGHWCAVLNTGAVRCGGTGNYGQLGNGTSTNVNWITGHVAVSSITNAVKIYTMSAGYSTNYGLSCALLRNGQIKCWGYNGNHGRLGFNSSTDGTFNTPQTITSGNGIYYSGIGAVTVDKTIPELKDGITAATSVSAGSYHACAIEGGTVRCWGSNSEGQLGNNSTNSSNIPVGVFGISQAKQLTSGYMHTCAILIDGTVKCWGLNRYGQLGNGTQSSSTTPVTVSGITDVKEISAGDYHTCALLGNGTVSCWGLNDKYQLGSSFESLLTTIPALVPTISGATRITSGEKHTCVIDGGQVKCWGSGDWGQLGNGYIEKTLTPIVVPGISTASRIGAGAKHTCVVLTDTTMRCWGLNHMSQQASTAYFSTTSVANLLGTQNILNVVGGSMHTCTISTDLGNLNCFGGNVHGQLGIGNMNTTSNVALVTYPVSDNTGVTNYTLALCETRESYNGNLGGIDGANAICQTQCGQGYKFAREAELANFNTSAHTINTYWIDRALIASNNCQNWTDGNTSSNGSIISFNSYNSTYGIMNDVRVSNLACNNNRQLICVRGVR